MRGLGTYPKAIRAQFRELIGLAHERDLAAALEPLALQFDAWRQGALDPFELNQLVHEYHHGPSIEIWKRYDDIDPQVTLAQAIARGLIREDEVSPEVHAIVAQLVQHFSAWSDEPEELSEPDY
jgi:hypothetical protein